MGHIIEPLPDEDPTSPTNTTNTLPTPSPQESKSFPKHTGPVLPPALATLHNQSPDDMLASLNRHPLFMTHLDETNGADGENVELEALRALTYEGTPSEVAGNFKEQGNELFRERRWADAVRVYGQGLDVLKEERKKREGVRVGEERAEEELKNIEQALYLNRAAGNLELKNYRRALNDCTSALALLSTSSTSQNPNTNDTPTVKSLPASKAHYRSAQAYLALSDLTSASSSLDSAITTSSLPPTHPSFKNLRTAIDTALASQEHQAVLRAQREEIARTRRCNLTLALNTRGIKVRNTGSVASGVGGEKGNAQRERAVELEDAEPTLTDPDDPASELVFPLLVLYPLAGQSDFVKAVGETETLGGWVERMLPVPWETDQKAQNGGQSQNGEGESGQDLKEYASLASFSLFVDTPSGGLAKVGHNVPLREVLSAGKAEVVDGLVRVYVVPKKRVGEWVEEMRRRKGKS